MTARHPVSGATGPRGSILRGLLLAALVAGLGASVARAGTPLTAEDRARLEKLEVHTHLAFEHYGLPDTGSIGLIGLKYDHFLTPHWFWGPAVYGAVLGKRGGFGIAALGGGYQRRLAPRLHGEARLLTGAGGGSGVKTGGGLLLHGIAGVEVELARNVRVALHGGYLGFPSGTYHTPVASLAVVFTGRRVVLPY